MSVEILTDQDGKPVVANELGTLGPITILAMDADEQVVDNSALVSAKYTVTAIDGTVVNDLHDAAMLPLENPFSVTMAGPDLQILETETAKIVSRALLAEIVYRDENGAEREASKEVYFSVRRLSGKIPDKAT